MVKESCDTCRLNPDGFCHLNPPVANLWWNREAVGAVYDTIWQQPPCLPEGWCAQYQPKG